MVYCSVFFMPLGMTMSYPWPCVCQHPPLAVRCPDPQAVAVSFLGDVATRVTTVCGQPSPVNLESLARPVAGLQPAQGLQGLQHQDDGPQGIGHDPPNLRGIRENTSSPRQDEDDVTPASCPLSMATQTDVSTVHTSTPNPPRPVPPRAGHLNLLFCSAYAAFACAGPAAGPHLGLTLVPCPQAELNLVFPGRSIFLLLRCGL